jgi:hypothetical protein
MYLFIEKNITLVAIFLFLVIFYLVQYLQPSFLYNKNGSVKDFGVAYRNKTILPIWLFAIILGILSYIFVLYYINHKISFR